jgi:hypothetical protein
MAARWWPARAWRARHFNGPEKFAFEAPQAGAMLGVVHRMDGSFPPENRPQSAREVLKLGRQIPPKITSRSVDS